MLFGSSSLIGLDIGTSSIKLVEVDTGRRPTLTNFAFVPTPRGAISGGEILNPDILSEAIRQLIQLSRTKKKRACAGLWGAGVITKKISIPRIEEKLLPAQLKWEAEQYIPFDINDISLEYHLLRRNSANPDQMDIVLVAAKKDFVFRFADVVQSAGLDCQVVDVAGFALSNCFEANYRNLKGQTVVLLNVGAGITNFVVLENGEVTFSRDIAVGGQTYTADVQKVLNISFEEAEAMKISAGTGQPVPQEVSDSISTTNEAVAEEIRRSYDFFLATSPDISVTKGYATGGGLGVPGLFEQMQSSLGIPMERLNPFKTIQFSGRAFTKDYITQIAPYISVGIGLALRVAK